MKALVTGFHMPYRLSPDLKYPWSDGLWSGENTGPIENTGPKYSTPRFVRCVRAGQWMNMQMMTALAQCRGDGDISLMMTAAA